VLLHRSGYPVDIRVRRSASYCRQAVD